MPTDKRHTYRRKDLFLQVGKQYEVVTHPERGSYMDLPHPPYMHFFEQGTRVVCTEVHWGFGALKGVLMGDFLDQSGMTQSLTVMDVKLINE